MNFIKHSNLHMRFQVFTVAKIQVKVFWVVMLCSVTGHKHLQGHCCLQLLHSDDGGSRVLCNNGISPQCYMGSQLI